MSNNGKVGNYPFEIPQARAGQEPDPATKAGIIRNWPHGAKS